MLFSFFDDEMLDFLVIYTNLYASGQNRVADVIIDEMHCFIGIFIKWLLLSFAAGNVLGMSTILCLSVLQ